MAIVVKFAVIGMSSEKYDAVLSRLEAEGAGAPPGRLYHVSYGSRDNVQVIDVFESSQAFEAFLDTDFDDVLEFYYANRFFIFTHN